MATATLQAGDLVQLESQNVFFQVLEIHEPTQNAWVHRCRPDGQLYRRSLPGAISISRLNKVNR